MVLPFKSALVVFALSTVSWSSFCLGQTPRLPAPDANGEQPPVQQMSGGISGTVVDQSGALIAGARVRLTRPGGDGTGQGRSNQDRGNQDRVDQDRTTEDQSLSPEMLSGSDGQFSFANIAPGPFQLTVTSAGFAAQTTSGILRSGELHVVPPIALAVSTNVVEMQVGLSQIDVAEDQMKVEEKQRVLGVLPNFYVSYDPHAVSLTSKQKFKLAWKTVVDPFTFVVVAGAAGVEQAQNHFNGYGQGVQGYGKRFGAGYADTVAGTFIGAAILPSLLKQDPRYFYKGTGSAPSRFLYAIGNSVVCKGDNGRWQANYSNVLGSLAAGGISNLYYPAQDRNGAGLTLENGALGIGVTAIANVFQEFFIRKLTPKPSNSGPPKP
jgi:Carboxypeptidase regulatory-like domain